VLERDDLRKYGNALTKRQAWRLPALVVTVIITTLILITAFAPAKPANPAPVRAHSLADLLLNVFLSLLLPLLTFAAFWVLFFRMVRRQQNESGVFEPQTISISPEQITQRTSVGESKFTWRAIKDLHRTVSHIFITPPNHIGYVIPMWAFPHPADAESFFVEAKGYWENAKKKGG
jgi:hypothetical protein